MTANKPTDLFGEKVYIGIVMTTTNSHLSLRTFLQKGKTVTYTNRETIINVGFSPEADCYWIKRGYVKASSYGTTGNEHILYIYGPDDFFPVGWFFAESPFQHVTFAAIGHVELIASTKTEFMKYITEERFTYQDVNSMLLKMHDRIYNLNLETAEQRVQHAILTMALRREVTGIGVKVIKLPITNQQLADYVRTSRETVGKILSHMEDLDLIVVSRQRILVDTEKLTKVVEAGTAA